MNQASRYDKTLEKRGENGRKYQTQKTLLSCSQCRSEPKLGKRRTLQKNIDFYLSLKGCLNSVILLISTLGWKKIIESKRRHKRLSMDEYHFWALVLDRGQIPTKYSYLLSETNTWKFNICLHLVLQMQTSLNEDKQGFY
jgi:hypothetical protein